MRAVDACGRAMRWSKSLRMFTYDVVSVFTRRAFSTSCRVAQSTRHASVVRRVLASCSECETRERAGQCVV